MTNRATAPLGAPKREIRIYHYAADDYRISISRKLANVRLTPREIILLRSLLAEVEDRASDPRENPATLN